MDLLFVTDQKDGDSWVASDGKEYRLGLINTPERNEQCGKEATAFTSQFLSAGFVADAYTTTPTAGASLRCSTSRETLNVALASSGFGNDQYLEEFRHENPDLGRRLDRALASAATPDCRKAAAPVPLASKPSKAPAATSKCMAGYSPCLPIVADLNCSDIGHPVTVTGSDPYRLDRDHDGNRLRLGHESGYGGLSDMALQGRLTCPPPSTVGPIQRRSHPRTSVPRSGGSGSTKTKEWNSRSIRVTRSSRAASS